MRAKVAWSWTGIGLVRRPRIDARTKTGLGRGRHSRKDGTYAVDTFSPARQRYARMSMTAEFKAAYQRAARLLGLRIRSLRDLQGWTLEQAAAEMSIHETHLQKVESGMVNITLQTLFRIAAGLRVPTRSLFASQSDGLAIGYPPAQGANDTEA